MGYTVHCRMLSSFPSLYFLDTSSTQFWQPKISSKTDKCPLRSNFTPPSIGSRCFRIKNQDQYLKKTNNRLHKKKNWKFHFFRNWHTYCFKKTRLHWEFTMNLFTIISNFIIKWPIPGTYRCYFSTSSLQIQLIGCFFTIFS